MLTLISKYQITSDVAKLFVTDITGQYATTTNETGWGPPNPEISKSAIAVVVQRFLDGVASSFSPVGNYVVYDPTAVDTKQTLFEFNFLMDGHIKVTIFRLQVSLDGLTTVEGTNLVDGDYFYWSNSSLIWQMVGTVPVAVDIVDLIGEATVVQSTCEALVFPKLIVERNTLYTEYMAERDSDCGDKTEALFQEILHFDADLAGAMYRFKTGAVLEAEDIVESLLKKYDLLT